MNLINVARFHDICELIVSIVYDGKAQRRDAIWRRKLGKIYVYKRRFSTIFWGIEFEEVLHLSNF